MTQDPDKIVKLFTPEIVYAERRFHEPMRGVRAVRSYWQDLVHDMQRDVHFEFDQVVVVGNQAFVHWHAHFSWRPINGILELDALSRITFTEERSPSGILLVSHFEEWMDSREG
jgi:ketosteroid isomerase-like protein